MSSTGGSLDIVVLDHESMVVETLSESSELDAVRVTAIERDAVSESADPGVDCFLVADAPPAQDGLVLYERVRAADPEVPVILLGRDADADRIETALCSGVTDYLQWGSPEATTSLLAKVRAHVRSPQLDGAVLADEWREIASGVSHDIKNPMNVIVGRMELLDVQGQHGEAIDRSMTRVLSLLDELSTIGKSTPLVRDPETVDLATVSRSVWRVMDTGEAGIVVETDRTVTADETRLKTMLTRLFENALDHAGDGVTVRIGGTETGFFVEDDGPGIPEDERSHVFEQGYGTAPDREGYGLFVVRRIARSHGWTLDIADGDDGGTRLTVDRVRA